MAIMLKKATEPMPRPRKFVADLPKRTEQVLLKALEKDPAQRFRDMAAFADELESLLAGQAAAPRPVKEPKRRPAPALHATRDQVERPDVLEKRPLEELKPRSAVNLVWVFGAGVIGLIILGVAASLLAGKPSGLFTMRTPTHTRTLAVTRTSTRTPTHTRTLAVTRTYTPTFGIGSTWVRPADGMVMVYVPAGEFNMGSNDGSPDQQPVHTVFLDALWIDRTEVTNAMYALCVQAGVCNPPDSSSSFDRISYYGNPQFDDYPVIHVSWQDAYSYCQWTDVRLPTEAEWEKAARGTDGRIYPWGNSSPSCSLANYSGCVGNTSAVGSYPAGASPYGALDMAGNVWEWVNDWYGETYYNQSVGASNPQGPANGNFRVFRGGAWYDIKGYVSASYRFGSNPALSDRPLGFRCSRPLP